MTDLTKWTEIRNELVYNDPMQLLPLLTKVTLDIKLIFNTFEVYDE